MANAKKEFKQTMTIGEALKLSKKAEAVFLGFGMHCLHCPMSQMETIEEAAGVHGINPNDIIEKLNEVLK